MSEFKLEAVVCKSCGSGLSVEMNDNIVYCTSCGNGFEEINGEMKNIEINFANAAFRSEGELIYKPFWLLNTTITILERKATGSFLKNLFGGSGEFTGGDILFYIPAFYCNIESMEELSKQFTIKNPVASPQKYNSKLTGFAYGKEDAKKLAEFILISLEAEKSDVIKNFRYEMKVNSYSILGIPFYDNKSGMLKDAVLGIDILEDI
ncbi:MAG TPA: hypothetical protein PK536_07870 [Ignavibacteria bacterium]|nr:hypothetical protein [Bacteroidota bacterium]HRI85350.1 hypothetical protein [Ignavibacteria bacterium]HRJ99636.1 hypothetical protein [Ignavibacteria bacterium]